MVLSQIPSVVINSSEVIISGNKIKIIDFLKTLNHTLKSMFALLFARKIVEKKEIALSVQ